MKKGVKFNQFGNVDLTLLIDKADRIVYQHNGVKTRRAVKVTKKSVFVVEDGKSVKIRYDQILRA